MKRLVPAIFVIAVSLNLASSARAQMGSDFFKRLTFTKVFNPALGKGAEYETTRADSKGGSRMMQMYIVGKESVDGNDGYWMEFVTTGEKDRVVVGKTLFTKDDFQFRRMIMQMPGQPPMEMPFKPNDERSLRVEERLSEWRSVGTETITVPAGTFLCEHWKDEKNNSDAWTSDRVTPFGMVKESGPHNTMVLTKILSDMSDRITGPVQKFDPQMMMQQMEQQRQQQQPKP
jgi:hypothetical protein